jgi:hypothetical protein
VAASEGLPASLRLLARAGRPGRRLAARLDLLRSIGVASALARRREERAFRRFGNAPWGVYTRIWSEAAAELGAEHLDTSLTAVVERLRASAVPA